LGAPDAGPLQPTTPSTSVVARGAVSALEREALATRTAIIVRADLARFRLTGGGSIACLQGLVTCDVEKPGDGSHVFGALLTVKGMIVSPLWIARAADALYLEAPAGAAAEIEAVLERSLPPRLCRYEVVTAEMASVGVYGPAAPDSLAAVAEGEVPATVGRVTLLRHTGAPVIAARVAWGGLDGFDCITPVAAAKHLAGRLAARGATTISPALLEERRILAGFPRLGAEIDERTLPQEARLDELGAVSYTKGCYLGQETVARVHFRGHANRRLAGVALERAPGALPQELVDGERKTGRLTSACWWEEGQGYAGLAVVRREVATGSTVRTADGLAGTVRELPLVPRPVDGGGGGGRAT
jgi:folate-binding protein YgfZ